LREFSTVIWQQRAFFVFAAFVLGLFLGVFQGHSLTAPGKHFKNNAAAVKNEVMLLQNALTMETADKEATKDKLAVAEHDLVALKQEQQMCTLDVANQKSALTKESAAKAAAKELAITTQKKLTKEKDAANELANTTQKKLTKEKADKESLQQEHQTCMRDLAKENADKEAAKVQRARSRRARSKVSNMKRLPSHTPSVRILSGPVQLLSLCSTKSRDP